MTQPGHPHADDTPEALAKCAAANDCAACFEEIVRRFQTPLLHFLIRRTSSRHDAEDLIQETFLLAYRNLGSFRDTWRLSTWLFTIANRLAVSCARRSRTQATFASDPESDSDPPAEAERHEIQGKLWDAARLILEPDAFTAVWLSYVESMPADQIGQVIGRNANAVRILLHRARKSLTERLTVSQTGASSWI
jgi:RNA polymerase sigma-70 factor (ECF subfamily)